MEEPLRSETAQRAALKDAADTFRTEQDRSLLRYQQRIDRILRDVPANPRLVDCASRSSTASNEIVHDASASPRELKAASGSSKKVLRDMPVVVDEANTDELGLGSLSLALANEIV